MSKISVTEHLKKLKKLLLANNLNNQKIVYKKDFSPAIKQNLKKIMPMIKTLALTASVSVLSIPAIPRAYNQDAIPETAKIAAWQKNVDVVVNDKTQQLQQKILCNIDSLQQQILSAKKSGKKVQFIKNIFNKVYPNGGLTGNMNYCVAGAMYAQNMCHDDILQQILPDAKKIPQDYNYSSHPNVSCPYMRAFFKENMPQNYAERGDKNFKETIRQLEAGDVITISSSVNTSSGEHCVTCAGKVENGKVTVKSFNGERTYDIPISKIVGAARIVNQYRQNLTDKLLKERDLSNFASLEKSAKNITFEDALQISQQKQRG